MKVVSETIDEFRTNVREFCERLKQYLTSLPITNYIKERLSELRNSQISQYAWNAVRDTAENIKDYMPTPELKVLINMIVSTIDKVNHHSFALFFDKFVVGTLIYRNFRIARRLSTTNRTT